jgi:hypothetical protein
VICALDLGEPPVAQESGRLGVAETRPARTRDRPLERFSGETRTQHRRIGGDNRVVRTRAELREGVFMLRVAEGGRIDADFVLTLRTPEGIEHWDHGWNHQDVSLLPAEGCSLRQQFEGFMRSLFEDHMYDLAERGLSPDRDFDALSVRIEVPDEIVQRLG